MIEKSHLTPSRLGMDSSDLAKLMYWRGSMAQAEDKEAFVLRFKCREEEAAIINATPHRKRQKLLRMALDQVERLEHSKHDNPKGFSLDFHRHINF